MASDATPGRGSAAVYTGAMDMNAQQWEATATYLQTVFGTPEEDHIAQVLAHQPQRAAQAGLPPIAISADVGRLLSVFTILATRTSASTGRVVEVGTLGGYSGLWIARALPEDGKLTTFELNQKHADFARREFDRAGLGDRVQIIVGPALQRLPQLAADLGPDSLDMVFLDAHKPEYPDYAKALKPVLRRGGLLTADNALGSAAHWITQSASADTDSPADRFNRLMAADPDFETGCILNREGLLVAVRR